MASEKRPTALGAYIFAGGFTVGVAKHFDVLAHFEDGSYGTETAQHNFPELRGNVHTDPAAWPAERFKGKVDFLFSNPPCAPWSRASEGRATPWNLDPRLDCVRRSFALVGRVRPKVWAWESVRGAWRYGRELVETVARAGMALGYCCTVCFVDGTHHGVAQRRPRLFVVLHRMPIDWEPTGLKKPVTVADAILKRKFKTQTLAPAPEGYLKLLRQMRKGEIDLRQTFNRLHADQIEEAARKGEHVSGRPSFQNRRIRADRPSLVLTGGAKLFHPTEDRFISVEESAAMCGYPRDFVFKGTVNKQYAQVAQAVMPPVAEYLARVVAGSLGNRAVKNPFFECVDILPDDVARSGPMQIIGGSMSLEVGGAE
jgi:DNA (cytosine-5)-methyltransferase 1